MTVSRWYMSPVSRQEAEAILLERNDHGQFSQRDGAFLVRPSESTHGEFSISVKSVVCCLIYKLIKFTIYTIRDSGLMLSFFLIWMFNP